MDSVLLSSLLSETSQLFKLPISLFDQDTCIVQLSPLMTAIDITRPWRSELSDAASQPSYYVTKDLLMLGRVQDTDSHLDIYFGPVFMNAPTTNQIRTILASLTSNINAEALQEAESFCHACDVISFRQFLRILCNLDGYLNHRNIGINDVTGDSQTELDTMAEAIQNEQSHIDEDVPRQSNYDYESRLLYYVEHGMEEEIKNYTVFKGYLPPLASDTIRSYKNALIILNSLCIRAAIRGGLDQNTSYQLGEVNIQHIESCQTINQLIKLNTDNRIAADFAIRIRYLQDSHSHSQKIREAMLYIRENYQKRLTVSEIAEAIEISPEYLSSLFHKENGITIPDYIARLKIDQARALLQFTDLSISSISELLSFSSQSYFQSTFKKLTGTTPMKYRGTKKGI